MHILLFGADGMLGHVLWSELSADHEVWATARHFPDRVSADRSRLILGVDVDLTDTINRAFATARPDVVINAVGIVKQRFPPPPYDQAILVNSVFPHELATVCKAVGARLIQFSSDCVFTGHSGPYTESADDWTSDPYGHTKLLGEVPWSPHVTFRTSFIGPELRQDPHGLFEWVRRQRGNIDGWINAIWSGLTTYEIARFLRAHVIDNPGLTGLYNLASEPISKYSLIRAIADLWEVDVDVRPVPEPMINRELTRDLLHLETGYQAPPIRDQLEEMRRRL